MKKINFSKHVTEDRMDRYLFIATHMGFGEIIYETWDDDKYNYKCITSTGVVLVLSPDKETVITLFLGDYDKIYALMKGEVPPELKKTLKQYAKKGWIK